jgi:hypothetical protein
MSSLRMAVCRAPEIANSDDSPTTAAKRSTMIWSRVSGGAENTARRPSTLPVASTGLPSIFGHDIGSP